MEGIPGGLESESSSLRGLASENSALAAGRLRCSHSRVAVELPWVGQTVGPLLEELALAALLRPALSMLSSLCVRGFG